MKYFTNCHTLDELKKEYRRLAMKNHPDHGGNTETMKAINAEYEPEITFSFDHEAKTVEPLTFQNDYMGYYREVYKEINGRLCYSKSQRTDNDEFLWQWLKNIEMQGYELVAATA